MEDVIVAIDGEPVGYVAELQAKIAEHRPGDQVEVTIYRDGRPSDISVELGEAPLNNAAPIVSERTALSDERLGINVEPLDTELAEEIGYEEPGGVVLREVAPGSPAARRSVAAFAGQKLIRINDDEIDSPEDVRQALDRVEEGQIVSLHFQNPAGIERVVNVRMP
jgi:serine protease Do